MFMVLFCGAFEASCGTILTMWYLFASCGTYATVEKVRSGARAT